MKLNLKYHILAFLIVLVWGSTFISSKVLILNGFNAAEIFLYRFFIAYILILIYSICKKDKVFALNLKDEIALFFLGVSGGSLYFLAENTALKYTNSTNVSFILCLAPIFTAVLLGFYTKKLKSIFGIQFSLASIVALIGVGFLSFNSKNLPQISIFGDILSVLAALSWAFYTLVLNKLNKTYSSVFIARKVFFYGVLSILPSFFVYDLNIQKLFEANLIYSLNFAYLSVIASFLCFILWTRVVKGIGAINATNYVYLSPLITFTVSAIVLNERLSGLSILGAILILFGTYFAMKPKAQ